MNASRLATKIRDEVSAKEITRHKQEGLAFKEGGEAEYSDTMRRLNSTIDLYFVTETIKELIERKGKLCRMSSKEVMRIDLDMKELFGEVKTVLTPELVGLE